MLGLKCIDELCLLKAIHTPLGPGQNTSVMECLRRRKHADREKTLQPCRAPVHIHKMSIISIGPCGGWQERHKRCLNEVGEGRQVGVFTTNGV
jgi:hypothetical protein